MATAKVQCPYCWEELEVTVDETGGDRQEYVEDCPVCCRPWNVTVTVGEDRVVQMSALSQDE